MILAAPLVIPFAKAVGLSVGTLGMAALADQVNDYIQENPEESMKILSTIIPNVGIGQIFMSKEDKISLEDLDEMTDEEAQDLSKEEKAELMKQAGKSGGKNKRQTMIDISEKLGLSGEGKEKQDIEYEIDERYDEGGVEDAPKPKFDYTKFFRKRRADGGAIGIEVLFEEKKPRKDFNLGGLTGQAKSIYDFMNAAGYFTEDEIRNAIIGAGYEIPGAASTTATATATAPAPETGTINQQLTPQRDDRVIGLQETFTKDLSGDPRFNYLEPTAQANKYRFDRSVEPREGLLGFFDSAMNKMKESKFLQPKVRGTLGTRIANQPRLPLPGAIAAYSMSPFNPESRNYNPLLEGQLNFLEGLEDMIGRDQQSGGLKYGSGSVLAGKNVISGFGSNNYEVALNKYLQRMNRYENPTKKQQEKIAQAQAELAAEKERQIREAKTKAQALAAIQSQGKMDYNPNIHGPVNYGKDSEGNQSFDSGMGFGIGSDGGPVSNRTGKGRTGYSEGGLATMFVEKR